MTGGFDEGFMLTLTAFPFFGVERRNCGSVDCK